MSKFIKLQIRTALRALATMGLLGFIVYYAYSFTSKSGYGHFAPSITDREIEGNSFAFGILAVFLVLLAGLAIFFTLGYMTDRFIHYSDKNHLRSMGMVVCFALAATSFYAVHICDPLPHNLASFIAGIVFFVTFITLGVFLGIATCADTQSYLDRKID